MPLRTTQHPPLAAQPIAPKRRNAVAADKPAAPGLASGQLGSRAARGNKETSHPPSSPELIFREIVQGLYNGTYVPGQRLVEVDLTQRWGVSRGTVREALNRLAAEGIVVLNRHRGAAIRVLNRAEMQDILAVPWYMRPHGTARGEGVEPSTAGSKPAGLPLTDPRRK